MEKRLSDVDDVRHSLETHNGMKQARCMIGEEIMLQRGS